MNEYVIVAAGTVGGIVGGALGARLSKAPVWKGALLAAIASLIQFVIGELADIEQPLVSSLVYLLAIGLIGGRWGMGLTARQLSHIVIGSFLLALLAGVAAIYFSTST
ncbi:hypothetical protein [Sinorhizobium sp. RAC02]|uniref:hypothetical protein n=1 Tax=Sinorhizobium sp. RAC02 TaxID=1842534 RepID=UPI000855D3C1|nr:hypothetical protein [Sinorhizobium sp. RAC02]AOF92229.1 putative membrane protein [Sinorhizobium sp. RAC02]